MQAIFVCIFEKIIIIEPLYNGFVWKHYPKMIHRIIISIVLFKICQLYLNDSFSPNETISRGVTVHV